MRRITKIAGRSIAAVALTFFVTSVAVAHENAEEEHSTETWSVNASIIESTTAALDCAYAIDTTASAVRGSSSDQDAPCRYNRAVRINTGRVGDVVLDEVRLWMAGARATGARPQDQEWSDVVFDPSATPAQRMATLTVLSHLYRREWPSLTVVGKPATVDWEASATHAYARLGGGQAGEIALSNVDTTPTPIAATFRYAAAPRSAGAIGMRSGSHEYKRGPLAFFASRTPGVVVTVDMSSDDLDE